MPTVRPMPWWEYTQRCSVGVGVAGLAHEHDGGLVVAAGGHLARHDAANHLFQVFLAAEEDFDVLVEASPAVVAGIDDDALLEVVFTEDVGVDVAVALVVHAGDVDVAERPPERRSTSAARLLIQRL